MWLQYGGLAFENISTLKTRIQSNRFVFNIFFSGVGGNNAEFICHILNTRITIKHDL